MWYFYVCLGLILFWFFALRPRGGGKNSPPLVTSKVVPFPLVGVICEFLKNPNEMMKRCYKDYGQVFTIPVSDCGAESDACQDR
jgi:hypothetical protein